MTTDVVGTTADEDGAEQAAPFVMPDEITIDFEFKKLNLGDIEDLEDLTGLGLQKLGETMKQGMGAMDVKLLRAVAYISMRREYPAMTFEDTRQITLAAFADAAAGGSNNDPQ